jgi:predicted flap endonuclease-1-like 5' DNA nuclease
VAKLSIIEGIKGSYENRLKYAGLRSMQSLLEVARTQKGRRRLSKKTGIPLNLISKWTKQADLLRIKGVGVSYADLLEAAGIESVPELARRRPENVWAKIVEVNQDRRYVRKIPALRQVANWVRQAAELPRVVYP